MDDAEFFEAHAAVITIRPPDARLGVPWSVSVRFGLDLLTDQFEELDELFTSLSRVRVRAEAELRRQADVALKQAKSRVEALNGT